MRSWTAALIILAAGAVALVTHPVVVATQVRSRARVSKAVALDSVARTVLAPAYADLEKRAAALSVAAGALVASPTAASLERTRLAWIEVLLAWRRTQAYIQGPVADLGAYGRLQFWPLRLPSIDRVIKENRAIDETYVSELGANAIGLFPMEVLLFGSDRSSTAALLTGTGRDSERRRLYVQAIARELASKTNAVARSWQGPTGYAARFGAGGQDQLNLLVNDMVAAVEIGVQEPLRLVALWKSVAVMKPELVEGGRSGAWQQAMLALLSGVDQAYRGGAGPGLDDYLAEIQPSTAARVTTQMQKAIAAVRRIKTPFGSADPTTDVALGESRALEILLKTEVVAALGVTLTFKSTDGD